MSAHGLRLGAGWVVLASVLWLACSDTEVPADEIGRRHFTDPRLSTSPPNVYSCSTCHAVDQTASFVVPGRFDAGYNLSGVATRSSWWGGYASRLLDAVNVCMAEFMGGRALDSNQASARALIAYLVAVSPRAVSGERTAAAPLTIVRDIAPLSDLRGDRDRGAMIYVVSCQRCHGSVGSGAGRSTSSTSIVPDDTLKAFPTNARSAIIEKIRHGNFFGIGGVMPFYTEEAMSDQAIADLLEYLRI